MIKRIRFATRQRDLAHDAFADAWPHAVAVVAEAPPHVRPTRMTVCTTMPELTGPELTGPAPKHDGIGFEWFADAGHLERFEAWLQTPDGRSSLTTLDQVIDSRTSPVIVAEECVLRGADWLEQRWRRGGEQFKHMAIAVRHADLDPAAFSARWRNHAGRLGRSGGAPAIAIPDDARGLAYVQNHPLPTGEWAYDALNEVWFDDVEGLRTRIEWFRENLPADREDDLVRQSWFIAAREQVVFT